MTLAALGPAGTVAPGVSVGLHEVAGSASLTLVVFPALVLLAVLGVRFGYYAYRNRTATELATQTSVWSHLVYVGLFAALYGLLGVVEIVSSIRTPYKSGVMLGMVFLLALSIRHIHQVSTAADAASGADRAIRGALALVVAAHVAGAVAGVPGQYLSALEGATGLVILTYGATFYHDQTSRSRLQGTMVDSLLRHLLPVLTFGSLVPVTALAYGLGFVGPNVVPHIQVVFVVMTASTLMTATIKLRQNLASL